MLNGDEGDEDEGLLGVVIIRRKKKEKEPALLSYFSLPSSLPSANTHALWRNSRQRIPGYSPSSLDPRHPGNVTWGPLSKYFLVSSQQLILIN
jgi:hypothetical protein